MRLNEVEIDDVIGDAYSRAIGYLGQGEVGGNNRGHFVDEVLESRGRRWAWCALLFRRCYLDALSMYYLQTHLVREHPYLWRVPPQGRSVGVPEPGALRLLSGMAKVGSKFKDPKLAIPGDGLLYKRPGGHHAIMVDSVDNQGIVSTIEGNVGAPPKRGETGAPVRLLQRDPLRDAGFRYFVTLRKGIR